MPTTPPSITALPAAPDPNNRATFNTLAYPWSAALPTFGTEVSAVATNVKANADEAVAAAITATSITEVAAAAANYKGLWSSLTGALNKPASVSHNGNYWALNTDLADVTTATPGVSASWQPLNIGAGGATETSSAVDITLTAGSFRVQAVAMTAPDKSVKMPSATTLQTGGEIFVVKNTGAIAYAVRDSAGTLLGTVDPGQLEFLYLVNASTSAGVWAVGNSQASALAQTIYQATALGVNAVNTTCLSVTSLSATQAIVVWGESLGGYACTLNLSGNTITAGATLNFSPPGNPQHVSVCSMSSTQAVVTIQGGSVFLNAYTLNVSGTTLSAGAALVVNAVASSFMSLASLSSTQAICAYIGTSGFAQAVTLNVSGTTLTNGAVLSVTGFAAYLPRVAAMSSTQAVLLLSSGSGVQAQTLNVSGTTISAGTALAFVSTGSVNLAIAPNSSTKAVIGYSASPLTNLIFRELYVSGTNCTVGPPSVRLLPTRSASGISLAKVSATKFAALYPSDSGDNTYFMQSQVLSLSDSVIDAGPPMPIKTSLSSGLYSGITSMSTTHQLAVYRDPSGYLQARILEIAA